MAFGTPPAFMGYVGFVQFDQDLVRATSADIRLSQEIIKPVVIDSRFDRTIYQLGPKIIEGTVEFPAIFDSGTTTAVSDIAETLYRKAVQRDADGKLSYIDIYVKYTTANAAFKYSNCIINNWRFSVAQSDVVTISTDIIGIDRIADVLVEPGEGYVDNTRIVTWNDAAFLISGGSADLNIGGEFVRTFDMEITNDAERYYTLNGLLFPQDVAPRKREVTGTVVLMGRHPDLASVAETNQDRCTETTNLLFGYQISNPACGSGFRVNLPNIVFAIETLALTEDIFETTVDWHCFPAGRIGSPSEQPFTDPLITAIVV